MPALNFQKQFADKVERGEKRQTIRKKKKHPIKAGDKLYLYTGMRTKQCRKLGEEVCKKVYKFGIDSDEEVYFDECVLIGIEKEQLAKDDGFECAADMIDWFKNTHGLPFFGQVILW